MNKDNIAFLLGGLAFGIVIGFGTYHAVRTSPDPTGTAAVGAVAGPQGSQVSVPQQPNAGGGAPMVAEINRLKRMLQDEPENAQILLRLANIYHDAAMWEPAIGFYERADKLSPNDPDLLTDLGVCYRGVQQFDRALDQFAKAQSIDANHWQALFNTVIVAGWDTGQFDVARRALDSMDAIDPKPEELATRLTQLRDALEQRAAAAVPKAS